VMTGRARTVIFGRLLVAALLYDEFRESCCKDSERLVPVLVARSKDLTVSPIDGVCPNRSCS